MIILPPSSLVAHFDAVSSKGSYGLETISNNEYTRIALDFCSLSTIARMQEVDQSMEQFAEA